MRYPLQKRKACNPILSKSRLLTRTVRANQNGDGNAMSCSNMTYGRDTYYVERANRRNEFWTYSDGVRVRVSEKTVKAAIRKGDKLVIVGPKNTFLPRFPF